MKYKPKKKIMIAVPNAGSVNPETMESLWNLKRPKGYEVDLFMPTGHSIGVSRNKCVIEARNRQCSHIFFVDSDMLLAPDALLLLFKNKKSEIVSGWYKKNSVDAVVLKKVNETGAEGGDEYQHLTVEWLASTKEKGVYVDAVGMGCCLIDLRLFDRMNYPFFVYYQDKTMQDVPEDLMFCHVAKNFAKAEIKIVPQVFAEHIKRMVL